MTDQMKPLLESLHGEFLKLVRNKKIKELIASIQALQDPAIRHDSFQRLILDLVGSRSFDSIREIDEQLGKEDHLRYSTLYALTMPHLYDNDIVKIDRYLRQSLWHCAALAKEPWARAAGFSIPSGWVDQVIYIDTDLKIEPTPAEQGLTQGLLNDDESKLVIVTSSNGIYFDRYALAFARSCRVWGAGAHLYFQVINPTEKTESIFRQCQRDSQVKASLATEIGPANPVHCACRRFSVASSILQSSTKDVYISDIDVEFVPSIVDLHEQLRNWDVALYEEVGIVPRLFCHCSLVWCQNTARTRRFLALLADYISQKLKEDSEHWMLDQCAMLVVSRKAITGQLGNNWSELEPLKWGNLRAITGRELSYFQVNQGGQEEEKLALRLQSQPTYLPMGMSISFDENLRPRLS